MEEKEPFIFTYTRPYLDWYEIVKVEVKWNDYIGFELHKRYGPSWWLIGIKHKEEYPYSESIELGELGYDNRNDDVKKFIKWAKRSDRGSKLIGITTIDTCFDIIKEIKDVTED